MKGDYLMAIKTREEALKNIWSLLNLSIGLPKRGIKSVFLPIVLVLIWAVIFGRGVAWAGPPFFTDDPEPADYKHGEFYFASQYTHSEELRSATLPHLEFNYGVLPDIHLHLITPLQYVKAEGEDSRYGYGDTELGIKYRFIQETESRPMVGTFPIVLLPTGARDKGLGSGETQIFLPLWVQKSWGRWTTYGGGGYWINPGEGNKNWWFFGWLVQRKLTEQFTVGAELFHRTASQDGGEETNGFQVGAIIDLTDEHHILLSAGKDFGSGPNLLTAYVGYQFTFGPKEKKVSLKFRP